MGKPEVGARLGAECRKARRSARIHAVTIAVRVGVGQATLSRFENGVAWPDRVEEIVRAYEIECGLPAEELWRRAICP